MTTSNTNTTEDNNKLIAEFMGMKEDEYPNDLPKSAYLFGNFMDNEIQYHSSWDWLMPVVGKIENLSNKIFIDTDSVIIDIHHEVTPIITDCKKDKINAVYEAVIQFIKYYNQQQRNGSAK